MFKAEIQAFDNSRKVVLSHSSGLKAEILADYGAALNAFFIPTRNQTYLNIIDGYNSANEPNESGAHYKGVFLFPFPNRLKNGEWMHEGKKLQFPINEGARNNALHGNLFNCSFEIVETSESVEMASVLLSYKPKTIPDYYPFDFQIDIEYILTESEGLTVKTTVHNLADKNLPFGLGWHPYFKTGSLINDLVFLLKDVKAIDVDSQMIPTGSTFDFRIFDNPQTIGEVSLDTGFELQTKEIYKVQILDPEKKLKFTVWQEAGEDGYQYIQIYTPPHRQSIAIEPMSARANALQDNSGGLQSLAPGNSLTFFWGIGL